MSVAIRQMLVSPSKYSIKCPYTMNAEYITVHNTANDATANNEVSYMNRNDNSVSFHFAVDYGEVVQAIPLNRNAWHCGDGSKGDGNRKSIGIEICFSKSGGTRYDKAEELTVELIAQLLKERGWGIDRVKTHKHWTQVGVSRGFSKYVKNCPHQILDTNRWDSFLQRIQDKMNPKPQPVAPQPTENHHTVIKNDSLWAISRKYNTSVDELKRINNLKSDVLTIGQKIYFNPSTPQPQPVQAPQPVAQPKPQPKPQPQPASNKLKYARVLKKGMKGEDVKALQRALNSLNFKVGTVDGDFGNKTLDAVKRFQSMYLPRGIDGIVGQNTVNKINSLLR